MRRFRYRRIEFAEACAFVGEHHRHHRPPRGHRFSIAAYEGERLVGVVIVGRPLSRMINPQKVCEVTRLCTDGTKDACSYLYGCARRAAQALGFDRLLTYTLPSEGGASLRAAGFVKTGRTKGGSWNCPARRRDDDHPTQPKDRYELAL